MAIGGLRVDAAPHGITQTFFGHSAASTPEIYECKRVWTSNTRAWGEWEWKNPPMWVGVEYRITERRNGKPVYTKLVDFGSLPANDTKSVDIGINASRVFALDGSAYSAIGTELVPLPTGYNGVLGAYAYVWGSGLYVRSTADLSNYSAAFVIKYI